MLMIITINWLISLSFVFMSHPLSLGFILLIQTISLSLMTNLLYYNSWFSYIMFLAMVSGLLIMFIYMTSIASNEKFNMPKLTKMMLSFFIISILIILLLNSDSFYINYMNNSLITLSQSFLEFNNISLKKFYNMPFMSLIIILMFYLFFTLIVIVKITNIKYGPLRQK
uniref:NADH dehydrogenase subunit 6 n=1 Tax=Hylurgus ligniperda TaxID=167147 RepID=UPI002797FF5B|nr:NADH dehydrogenase subunit 6 [Hylurgus ligniperda]WGL40354.1 NADH dehydrogenase subunit 6 [Hylurgus ligniperda]WKD83326.1 NADH dehydrogenase subunit 6 [Hylurgus ligniperda]